MDKTLEDLQREIYERTSFLIYEKIKEGEFIMGVTHCDLTPGLPPVAIKLNADLTWQFV